MPTDLEQLLIATIDNGASDLHLITGHPPLMRIHTELIQMDCPAIPPDQIETMLKEILPEPRYTQFLELRDADFSASMADRGRFRVNAHFQKGNIAISFRVISDEVPKLEQLNLPDVVPGMVNLTRGLIIVTGDTGSGKSTTMASMIQSMNSRHKKHIITLEDPIEYMLNSDKCAIEQREIGSDCPSFSSGLRHALRQDPDVILVGEMRDLETTTAAITAAETGHLVLSTLHTINASQTIERIIDIYPSSQQNQIRAQLANSLQAVISQTLFKRIDQPGMVPATEIMFCNSAVRNCIRQSRVFEIQNVIETSKAQGMQTLDASIMQLCQNGNISLQSALAQAAYPEKLRRALAA